eukprot:TRINITY_DN28277_c0_g1_i1.p1 TRINITY_DN28277_c0_g1~~TRINITY_DN28277_c0_g1_i1.p1  ORF type:complete len:101 (-),score=15.96 TRINITY_DN28277_c0_g1_i1:255-557(-)
MTLLVRDYKYFLRVGDMSTSPSSSYRWRLLIQRWRCGPSLTIAFKYDPPSVSLRSVCRLVVDIVKVAHGEEVDMRAIVCSDATWWTFQHVLLLNRYPGGR